MPQRQRESKLENKFLAMYQRLRDSHGLAFPDPDRQFYFAKPRRFRFDFAWPDIMLAVEIDGGNWAGGAHVQPMWLASQYEKSNLAVIRGWKLLRFTDKHLTKKAEEDTFETLLQAMGAITLENEHEA